MRDLEPYLCTFGGCLRPTKTYGVKSHWIQHETDVHRVQKSWLCRPCNLELASRRSFDDHMRERHFEFTRKPQLDAFAGICQKPSGKLKDRIHCPLCLQKHRNEERLQRYVTIPYPHNTIMSFSRALATLEEVKSHMPAVSSICLCAQFVKFLDFKSVLTLCTNFHQLGSLSS